MFSGMEECKITAWASDNIFLPHAVILHSSRPELSGEWLKYYVLCLKYQVTVVWWYRSGSVSHKT
jgi:hypothetical protein